MQKQRETNPVSLILFAAIGLIFLSSSVEAGNGDFIEGDVICTSTMMAFHLSNNSILSAMWEKPDNNLTLDGPCGSVALNNGTDLYQIILYKDCAGPRLKRTGVVPFWYRYTAKYSVYDVITTEDSDNTTSVHHKTINFQIMCTYDMSKNYSGGGGNTTSGSGGTSGGGSGEANTDLNFDFFDSDGNPIKTATLRQHIDFVISLKTDSYIAILPEECYFSDSSIYGDANAQTETFISGSCPVPGLSPMIISDTKDSSKQFDTQFEAFHFSDSYNVWVHCEVRLCLRTQDCTKNCTNGYWTTVAPKLSHQRRKRSLRSGTSQSDRLSKKLIIKQSGGGGGNSSASTYCLSLSGFILICVFLAVVSACLLLCCAFIGCIFYKRNAKVVTYEDPGQYWFPSFRIPRVNPAQAKP